MRANFAITGAASKKVPRLPFKGMKEGVLGSSYELSLVFISDAKMRALNKQYRKKDATTDILSFPLDEKHGEIFVSIAEAGKRAPLQSMTARAYLGFLFIHGLLHLKGYDHGSAMERLEKRHCAHFGIKKQWTADSTQATAGFIRRNLAELL